MKTSSLDRIRNWKKANPERVKLAQNRYMKQYRKNNPDYVAYWQRYCNEVLFKTVPYRVAGAVRSRITNCVRRGFKSNQSEALLGCTWDQFLGHLEIQFQAGMTWDNYGEWHIDHKQPCASFDLTKLDQQSICFNYKNLQPLWADENRRKGSKIHCSVISGSSD